MRIKQYERQQCTSYLQQQGDEDAVILFFTQKPQFGSEELMDPEDEESATHQLLHFQSQHVSRDRDALPHLVNICIAPQNTLSPGEEKQPV